MVKPFVIGVGGFTSNVGKTTLVCDLLRSLSGVEAIKTTRGHYRSCGKDSEACCVSHLLSEEPLVRSGREETYEPGKDTGRYWEAGASNVHWLIATDHQIEKGIKAALAHVKSDIVVIEGNSFSHFVRPDYFLMVKHSYSEVIKKSARAALNNASALYLSDLETNESGSEMSAVKYGETLPVFTPATLPDLIQQLQERTTILAA
jgi:molybdopterin-guanine dinucleotide biosynthesis protein